MMRGDESTLGNRMMQQDLRDVECDRTFLTGKLSQDNICPDAPLTWLSLFIYTTAPGDCHIYLSIRLYFYPSI